MKLIYITLFTALILLSGCSGTFDFLTGKFTGTISDTITIPLPPDARKMFDDAGGDEVLVTINAPLAPITTIPIYDGATGVSVIFHGQCGIAYDLTPLAGADASYFASRTSSVLYGPELVCGSTLGPCDYSIGMNGTVAEVDLVCTITP